MKAYHRSSIRFFVDTLFCFKSAYGDFKTLLGCLLSLVFTFSTSVRLETKSIFLFTPEEKFDRSLVQKENSLSAAVPGSGQGFPFSDAGIALSLPSCIHLNGILPVC